MTYHILYFSNSLLDNLKTGVPIKRDFDGIYYLDYLLIAICEFVQNYGEENLTKLVASITTTINNKIHQFEADGKLKEFSKWNWFKGCFEQSLNTQVVQAFLQPSHNALSTSS